MVLSNFFKRVSNNIPRLPAYNILIDAPTNIVLAVCPASTGFGPLLEGMDVREVSNVNSPNYQKFFFLITLDAAELPNWTWQQADRKFVRTPEILLTPEIRQLSQLVNLKNILISEFSAQINEIRGSMKSTLYFQETLYVIKRLQAEAFKKSGYDEKKIIEYPFVLQYAELSKTTYKVAADEILFKARLFDEVLAKSERLRLKYFQEVKNATSFVELKEIRRKFSDELHVNTRA